MSFQTKLKETRLQKGLSQSKVAALLEVAPSTYKAYESGYRKPNIDMLKKIVIALETTADELLEIK